MEANETAKQLATLWAPWRVEYFETAPPDPEFSPPLPRIRRTTRLIWFSAVANADF